MSTTVSLSAPRALSRRTRILAAASAVVAAASIAVTLAVGSGGSEAPTRPSAAPATLYQRGAEMSEPRGATAGERAAERFHHFR